MAKQTKKPKKDLVNLRSLGLKKVEQKFEKQHALKLLRLSNSAWELADDKLIFADNEIKRKPSDRDA